MTRHSHQLLPMSLLALLLAVPAVFAQEPDWDIDQRIASSGDDSEEFLSSSIDDPQRWPAGFSYAESSDLELGRDATHAPQIVGLRFADLQIPPGAQVAGAVIEFTANTDQTGPLAITILAQAAAATEPFIQDQDGQGSFDLTSRTTGSAAQTWSPEPWTEGEVYRTPDLAGIIQQIIDSEGWAAGGSLVVLLTPAADSGEGLRSAHAFDSDPQLAPRLLVAFADRGEVGATPAGEPEPEEMAPVTPDAAEAEPAEEEPAEEEPVDDEPVEEEPAEEEPAEEEPAEEEPADDEPVEAEPGEQEPGGPESFAAEPVPAELPAAEPVPGEVEVEPVDPDPIIPPSEADQGPSVWPGPLGQQSEGGRELAKAPEETPQAAGDDAAGEGEPRRARFALRPDAPRGLKGSALLSDYGGGITVITLFLDNPDTRVTYSASIRLGECGSAGNRRVDLEPVPGDRAFSTSLLRLDYDELLAGNYNIAIFRSSGNFTRVASCAQLAVQ